MKKQLLSLKNSLLLLILLLSTGNVNAQAFTCNLSSYDSLNVSNSKFRYYYSGTQTVTPIGTFSMAITVCGNNTMVYDTVTPRTNYVLIYSGATYCYKTSAISVPYIYIKNGGKFILKGTGGFAPIIYAEPTATFVNQSSFNPTPTTCSAMISPTNSPCNGTSTAVPDLSSRDEMNVFPNPCNKELNVNFANYINDHIDIYNTLGVLVRSQAVTGNSVRINMTDLNAGIYFVTTRNSKTQVKKIYVTN